MNHSRHHGRIGVVNWLRFGRRIDREIKKTGLSFRDLAHELGGPSAATLNRLCHSKPCSVEMYLWICHEFAISPTWAYRHSSVVGRVRST